MLKEQVEILMRENSVLKRAVSIQHERQKEFEERSQELQHLKQLVAQYQEQVRTLEVFYHLIVSHSIYCITDEFWTELTNVFSLRRMI